MERSYSLSSLNYSRLPACFGALTSSIDHKTGYLTVGIPVRRYATAAETLDALKAVREEDFPLSIVFSSDESTVSVKFTEFWTKLRISIDGVSDDKAEDLHQLIQDSLRLTEPTEDDERGMASLPHIARAVWQTYDKVEAVLQRIEASQSAATSALRCFVSFRFDEHSKALAFELREFLELTGVQFVSGLGFEPRSISAKVLERLQEPLDLFIVIYSTSGDSPWLNQEIGVARGRNLPILVLQEEGAQIESGLLGDTEHLFFSHGTISKAFVGILQALSYVRGSRGSD